MTHYYNRTTKIYIVALSKLFSDIHVKRYDENNIEQKDIKVPIIYASKSKLAYLLQKNVESDSASIVLPVIGFNIEALDFNPDRKLNPLNEHLLGGDEWIHEGMPWDYLFEVTVRTKYQDDYWQILEQLLYLFKPELSLDVKEFPTFVRDTQVALESVSMENETELSQEEDSSRDFRAVLSLKLKGYVYPSTHSITRIEHIDVNFINTINEVFANISHDWVDPDIISTFGENINDQEAPDPPDPPAGPEEQVFTVFSELTDGEIYNWQEDTWANVRDAENGTNVTDFDSNGFVSADKWDETHFLINRAFFEFDLSNFLATGRTIQSVAMDITGWSYNDSPVQIQQATFDTPLTLADYNAFTGDSFVDTPAPWQLWDGGDPYHNIMTLNTSGQTYIESTLGSIAKLCLREFDHDVNNVEPTTNNKTGLYYADDLVGFKPTRTPRLTITYLKVPEWSSHINNVDWTKLYAGTWDGVKWSSEDSEIALSANAFATNYKPYKVRFTFDGVPAITVEMFNTDGGLNLFDGREIFTSGEAKVIDSYNGLDISFFDIFPEGYVGDFNITNIEFLEA